MRESDSSTAVQGILNCLFTLGAPYEGPSALYMCTACCYRYICTQSYTIGAGAAIAGRFDCLLLLPPPIASQRPYIIETMHSYTLPM